MVAFTSPDNLPYPSDDQDPADALTAFRELAEATQAALVLDDGKTVSAGAGLTGGGPIDGSPTLAVGQGTGIVVGGSDVALDLPFADGRYAAKIHLHDYAPSSHTHPYSPTNHTHSAGSVGVVGRVWGPVTVQGGSVAGPFDVPHGLGRTPQVVMVGVTDDNGVMSVAGSVRMWDASIVRVLLRNFNASKAETVRVTTLAVG